MPLMAKPTRRPMPTLRTVFRMPTPAAARRALMFMLPKPIASAFWDLAKSSAFASANSTVLRYSLTGTGSDLITSWILEASSDISSSEARKSSRIFLLALICFSPDVCSWFRSP